MIKVNDVGISFVMGMTVADAIKISGTFISSNIIILVNGKFLPLKLINETVLIDGDYIKLLPLLSGG